MYDYGDKSNAGLERPVYTQSNAYASHLLDKQYYEGNMFNANGYVDIKFLKDFTFTMNIGTSVDEAVQRL